MACSGCFLARSTLLLHSFAPQDNSSPLFPIGWALFAKTPGVHAFGQPLARSGGHCPSFATLPPVAVPCIRQLFSCLLIRTFSWLTTKLASANRFLPSSRTRAITSNLR